MKKIYNIGLTLALAAIVFAGCKKPYDYDKEVAAPVSTPEKIAASISGSWQMTAAVEVDEKSLIKESMDITDFLTSDAGVVPNITFNTSNNTFTVDTAGLVLNFFKVQNGKWALDDDRYPTKIVLKDMSDNVVSELSIGKNLLSPSPQLNFIDGANCGTDKALSYSVSLVKK